jgi:hypothetical protein
MSAATGLVTEPAPDAQSLQEWIGELRHGARSTAGDSHVATVSAAAIDPLEIAASLEAAGMSRRVVSEDYGHDDVFGLAHEIWSSVPYREVEVDQPVCWRRGTIRDLDRGALYAAPALLIHGLTTVLEVNLAWWSLPLAMTWGWAMGQLAAFGGHTMRARGETAAERRLVAAVIALAIVSMAGWAVLARETLGGDWQSAAAAVSITIYMVASAVLLLHEEERLAALMLAPGLVAAGLGLLFEGRFWGLLAVGAVTLSFVAIAVAAARHLDFRPGYLAVTAIDVAGAAKHAAHGLLCGLALSGVVLLGVSRGELTAHTALLTMPLLWTLGVMEWRLRTFRAEIEELGRELERVDRFGRLALAIFARGFAIYLIAVITAAVVVVAVLRLEGDGVPWSLLTAQLALGAAYYIDLTLTSLGRVDVVLRAWFTGATVGASALVMVWAISPAAIGDAWWSGHVAAWAALVALLCATPRIITAPCSH